MALQTIPGAGSYFPALPPGLIYYKYWSFYSPASIIDATGEKLAFIGRVWTPSRGPKTLDRVCFRFGTVVKAGGSALTVSVQDADLANGPPAQPDGTKDQYRAIANADATFISSTWYRTGLLTSDGTDGGAKRSVSPGDHIAVVIEYDAAGRLGSDTVQIIGPRGSGQPQDGQTAISLYTAAWAEIAETVVNLIFEFSDGTFGTFAGGLPMSALGFSPAFKQNSNPDEYALHFRLSAPAKIDTLWAVIQAAANTSAFNLVLSEGSTPLATVAVDAHTLPFIGTSTASVLMIVPLPSEISLLANTDYYVSVQPSQITSNVYILYFDVADAGHFQAHSGGAQCNYTTRVDLGAWAAVTTTRRPLLGVGLSAFDDGVGGGGGPLIGGRLIR